MCLRGQIIQHSWMQLSNNFNGHIFNNLILPFWSSFPQLHVYRICSFWHLSARLWTFPASCSYHSISSTSNHNQQVQFERKHRLVWRLISAGHPIFAQLMRSRQCAKQNIISLKMRLTILSWYQTLKLQWWLVLFNVRSFKNLMSNFNGPSGTRR